MPFWEGQYEAFEYPLISHGLEDACPPSSSCDLGELQRLMMGRLYSADFEQLL